jgi:hypothetical protein
MPKVKSEPPDESADEIENDNWLMEPRSNLEAAVLCAALMPGGPTWYNMKAASAALSGEPS